MKVYRQFKVGRRNVKKLEVSEVPDSAKFGHILKYKNCVYFQNSTFQVFIIKIP